MLKRKKLKRGEINYQKQTFYFSLLANNTRIYKRREDNSQRNNQFTHNEH